MQCDIPVNAIFDMSNLGNLRELNISSSYRSVSERVWVLNNLKCLEYMTLRKADIDSELVRTLSQLKRLLGVTLQWCTELKYLHRIDDLGQLTTLDIESHGRGRRDLDIAVLVQRLSKLTLLKLQCVDLKWTWRRI